MSSKIWQDIYDAVWDTHPELIEEFDQCRDTPTILAFLNKHYPVDDLGFKWEEQLMINVPGTLRALPKALP